MSKPTHSNPLTHFNPQGEARMVDVAAKPVSRRRAVAAGCIHMRDETLRLIIQGQHKKGDVLGIARVAGIMAAKKTADLIPLCHPLPLTHIDMRLRPDPDHSQVTCIATVETQARTGVEMEALTAVHIALLTIYDMCKSADRDMTINNIRLLKKSGGQSGDWSREED